MSDAIQLTPAQQQALESLHQNRVLLSGAGCGKTFVLARRFTDLLMESIGEVDPARALLGLVALTFTEKAALEMQQRIRRFLRDRLAQAGSDHDRAILREWLEALPEARISTIHSFCLSLLRGHAIEAGLDPDFAVAADQIVTGRLLAEAAEQTILAAVEAGRADVARLLTGVSFNAILEEVRKLVSNRDRIDLHAKATPDAILAHWQAALHKAQADAEARIASSEALRAAIATARSYTCSDPTDKLLGPYNEILGAAETVLTTPLADCTDAAEILRQCKTGNVGSKKAWGVPGKEVRDALKAIGASIHDDLIFAGDLNALDTQAAKVLATLIELARDTQQRYAAEKRAQGVVDFADLIVATRNILRDAPNLAEGIGRNIVQILVDEAQDTDAVQIALLLGLLGAGDDVAAVQAGRLFLVGDAKQSIYRFRGAQVEVFQQLCDAMGPDAQIDLAKSFRTHPAGVAFVNHIFGPLLGSDYSPITAHREESPDRPSVELALAAADARSTQLRQAAVTADRIDAMLKEGSPVWDADLKTWRPVRPGDIAILFRRMTVSAPYERELQKRGIDYYVIAGSGFFRQQEVFDMLNALRVIDNPFDDVAFFGILRSQFVGLDDNALMHIARTHARPYLSTLDVARLRKHLHPSQCEALERITALLRRLGRVKNAVKISELVEAVLDATGALAVLLAQWKGKRQAGNVLQLLAEARAADGQLSLASFISQMDDFTLNNERYEQASTCGEGEDVVRLMTIHKSKGLEFPVVVVPDLNAGQKGSSERILHRYDWGLTTRLQPDEDGDDDAEAPAEALPRSYEISQALENRDALREHLRDYYVALTRHRDYLLLVGDNTRIKSGRFAGGTCFLNDLDNILGLSEALDEDASEFSLAYGEGFAAHCHIVQPPMIAANPADDAPGRDLLHRAGNGGELGELLAAAAEPCEPGELPLLGPLPPMIGHVELATTALAEFAACPALYRWRYELRAPTWLPGDAAGVHADDRGGLDPLTFGILCHRAMELLDVHAPLPARALIAQAAADIDLADSDVLAAAAGRFAPMLATFLDSPLAARLRSADVVHHELDFTTELGPALLRGQIDLLYRVEGAWHVVDYKTDYVHGNPQAKLERYRLQLQVYADAVRRFTDATQAPVTAGLYFLRTGQQADQVFAPADMAAAQADLAALASDLLAARRSGNFPRCDRDDCDFCRQGHLKHVQFVGEQR